MSRAGHEKLSNQNIVLPVAAATVIHEASIVALNTAGYAIEAVKEPGLIVAGCALRYTDNSTGEDEEVTVPVRRGTFIWNNDGTIKKTDCLKKCYVKDRNTVTITADGSSKAGIILEVTENGIAVDMIGG